MTAARVVCVGAATHDIIAVVEAMPAEDARVRAETIVTAGGGPAATAAVALARLGVPVAFVGTVGTDEPGRLVRSGLEDEGVDVRALRSTSADSTAQSLVLVNRANGSRTIVVSGGAAQCVENIPLGAEWLHVDQAGYAAVRTALARSGAPSPSLSVDAGNDIDGLELDGVALFAPTVAALSRRYPGVVPEDAMRRARDEGARLVVATAGSRGCLVLDGDEVVRVPPVAVEVTSTLGAGDVFHGALLAALVHGLGLVAAATFAAHVAALSCRELDGRSGIPSASELAAASAGQAHPVPDTPDGA